MSRNQIEERIETAKKNSINSQTNTYYIPGFGKKTMTKKQYNQVKIRALAFITAAVALTSGLSIAGKEFAEIAIIPRIQTFLAYGQARDEGLEKYPAINDICWENVTSKDFYMIYCAYGRDGFELACQNVLGKSVNQYFYDEGYVKNGMPSISYWENVQEAIYVEKDKKKEKTNGR